MEREIVALQEPDDDRRRKDDRKGAMQEVLCFFPHVQQNALRIGDAICRQFHDKRNRIAGEERLFQKQSGEDGDHDAQHIDRQHDQGGRIAEKGSRDHPIDRQLGTAGHERCQDDRHLTVSFTA